MKIGVIGKTDVASEQWSRVRSTMCGLYAELFVDREHMFYVVDQFEDSAVMFLDLG